MATVTHCVHASSFTSGLEFGSLAKFEAGYGFLCGGGRDFVRGLEILGRSQFLGRRISVGTRSNGVTLRKRELCSAPCGVFGKEADSSRLNKSEQSSRKSILRGSRGGQWGGVEEAVSELPRGDSVADIQSLKAVKESPGERFLNRALLAQNAKTQKDNVDFRGIKPAAKIKKEKGVSQVNALNHNQPSCYGCGAILQTSELEAPGYVPLQTFELKRKHHQLKTVLCGRCRLLSQGQMVPAVGGLGGYGSGKGYVPAEQLRAQLSHLRHQKALVVKLVDIVDFNGSFLGRVRDLVGANPIILVLTKVDLLPNGTDLAAVGDWLQEAVLRKKLNVISIHLTSSKAQTGISRVAADITRQRLGSANVGKSAFVTALLHDMGRRDPIASAALRFKPIQSAMPGTTLGPIEFEAFAGGGKLYDTPGVHLYHRMAASLDPQDVFLLAPRRRLRGYIIGPTEPEDEEPEESFLFEDIDLDAFLKERSGGNNWGQENILPDTHEEEKDEQHESWTEHSLAGYSLFWGGIVRIDVVKAPEDVKFTFYGPSAIGVLRVPTEEADSFYKENLGKKLRPPTSSTMGRWAGLEKVQEIGLISKNPNKCPAGDVAVSGLGWVTIGKATMVEDKSLDGSNDSAASAEKSDELSNLRKEDSEIMVRLHVPKAVEIFVRPSIPLGKNATCWFDYSDLTDAELGARPQIFY